MKLVILLIVLITLCKISNVESYDVTCTCLSENQALCSVQCNQCSCDSNSIRDNLLVDLNQLKTLIVAQNGGIADITVLYNEINSVRNYDNNNHFGTCNTCRKNSFGGYSCKVSCGSCDICRSGEMCRSIKPTMANIKEKYINVTSVMTKVNVMTPPSYCAEYSSAENTKSDSYMITFIAIAVCIFVSHNY